MKRSRQLTKLEPWMPPIEWVEIAFGRRPFLPRAGLYLDIRDWQRVKTGARYIGIQPLDQDEELVGAGFDFNDFGIALVTTPLHDSVAGFHPEILTDGRSFSL
jgi:hypothetical protein